MQPAAETPARTAQESTDNSEGRTVATASPRSTSPVIRSHSVSVPVELSDGTTAVARAAELHLPPGTAPSRVGHHHIDVSRAWLLHGNRDRALAGLQQARRVAPELTRYHPQVHETIRALVHAERRRSDKLAGFAGWAGVQA